MTPGGHELESQKQNKSVGANTDTPLPEGYRMTELGPLPEEWRVVRLGEVYNIQQGKALSPKHRKGESLFPFLHLPLWGGV